MMDDPVRNPYISESNIGIASSTGGVASLQAHVRTGQIITFAMITGVIVIAVVLSTMIGGDNQNEEEADPILFWLGAGAAGVAVVASFVVSSVVRSQAIAKFREQSRAEDSAESDDQTLTPAANQLIGQAQTATITGQAILEGATILNLVLMVVDHNPLHLAIAAVLVVGMAMYTPTIGKRRAMIEQGLMY